MTPIYHIATARDWAAARRTGTYTTSTLGRTLAEEGFIHASRREQVGGVWRAFYRDAGEPLVLLTIDPAALQAEVREDAVGEETFPHIYGPIPTAAVVRAQPLTRDGGTEPFTLLYLREILIRAALVLLAMALSFAGHAVAGGAGTVVGLLLGVVLAIVILRRRG